MNAARRATSGLGSLAAAVILTTCGPDPREVREVDLALDVDAPRGGETLTCYGFDASLTNGRLIASIAWEIGSGAVGLHHAGLYAVATDVPNAPTPCTDLPVGAVGLHIWVPGNDSLMLDGNTGLQIPSGTRSFLVQTHSIRTGDGPATAVTVRLALHAVQPAHVAAFIGANAEVPLLPPHRTSTAGTACRVGNASHVLLVWPHMHVAGREFHAAIVHSDGSQTTLADVVPWNFDQQRFYPVETSLTAGDVVRTQCIWENTGDAFIEPGPLTANEMCNFGLLLWPADAAHWAGPCE